MIKREKYISFKSLNFRGETLDENMNNQINNFPAPENPNDKDEQMVEKTMDLGGISTVTDNGIAVENVKPAILKEDKLAEVTKYYNIKQEKSRPMAILLMVLSAVSFVAVVATAVWITLLICFQLFHIDVSTLFSKDANNFTLGTAGLVGFLAYIVYFVVLILVAGVVSIISNICLKLFKNLKSTKQQPYHIVAFNGTLISSFFSFLLVGVVLTVVMLIMRQNNVGGVLLALVTAIAILGFVTSIALVCELVIARVKYNQFSDADIKKEIKNEAHARFKLFTLKDGHARKRAKERKRWF